jgi:Thioredoxin-like domain
MPAKSVDLRQRVSGASPSTGSMPIVLTALLMIGSVLQIATASRTVNIDLSAPWPRYTTSVIPEVSEFLSDHSPESFWSFVDDMCKDSKPIDIANTVTAEHSADHVANIRQIAVSKASEILPPTMRPLMESMADMGHYLPAVQFFSSVASSFGDPCKGNAFFVVYPLGKAFCAANLDQLWMILSEAKAVSEGQPGFDGKTAEKVLDVGDIDAASKTWDHPYIPPTPRGNGTDSDEGSLTGGGIDAAAASAAVLVDGAGTSIPKGVKVVLYGVLGSTSFCMMHSQLSAAASTSQDIRYSVRHAFPGVQPVAKVR